MKKRIMLVLLTAVLGLSAILTVQFTTDSLPTAAWGLSFRQEGAAPGGTATAEDLARYDAA